MSYQFRARGQLTFRDDDAARAAFESVMEGTGDDHWFRDALSLSGRKLRVQYDDFVSSSTDHDAVSFSMRLQAAAKGAEAGEIRLRSEGETSDAAIRAPAKLLGRAAKKQGGGVRFGLAGELTFANAEIAAEAFAGLSAPFKGDVPRGVRVDGETVSLRCTGKAEESAIYAVRRALFAWLPRAQHGSVRYQHMVFVLNMKAPVAPFGPQDGPIEYAHVLGGLGFRSAAERDDTLGTLGPLPITGTAKGVLALTFEDACTVTKPTFEAMIKAAQALLKRARRGEIELKSPWGFRNLHTKR